jgi:hypothetical protein
MRAAFATLVRLVGIATLCIGVGAEVTLAAPLLEPKAERYQAAQELLRAPDQRDRCEGLQILMGLVEEGETKHALELASRFESGRSVPVSMAKALFWYTYAAFNGFQFSVDDDAERVFQKVTKREARRIAILLQYDYFPDCTTPIVE